MCVYSYKSHEPCWEELRVALSFVLSTVERRPVARSTVTFQQLLIAAYSVHVTLITTLLAVLPCARELYCDPHYDFTQALTAQRHTRVACRRHTLTTAYWHHSDQPGDDGGPFAPYRYQYTTHSLGSCDVALFHSRLQSDAARSERVERSDTMRSASPLWLAALLLSVVLCELRPSKAESSFPASFVVLPLASFANQSLVAKYECRPTYAATACSGHGQCQLLFDSAQPSSAAAFLNSSSAQPIPASSTSLNPHDFPSFDMLPAAVCVCDNDWSGRGDFVNHFALDADSCAVNQHVVTGLCSALLALSIPLLLLSMRRLYCWFVWLPSPLQGGIGTVSTGPAAVSKKFSKTNADGMAVVDPAPKARTLQQQGSLLNRCTSIVFVHPLCSLIVSACLTAYLALRLWTDATVGTYSLMGALLYVHHIPACIALCANALSRIRLLASFARSRSTIDMFGRVVLWARRSYIVLNIYAAGVWVLVLLAQGKQGYQQQLYAVLVLALPYTCDVAVGVGQVAASHSISGALSLHLDRLSAEQRAGRLKLASKLRFNANCITFVLLAIVTITAWLVADASRRQAGLPYYALASHFITLLQAAARFHIIKPPKRSPSIVVAPEPPRVPIMGSRKQSMEQLSARDSQGHQDPARFKVGRQSPLEVDSTLQPLESGRNTPLPIVTLR